MPKQRFSQGKRPVRPKSARKARSYANSINEPIPRPQGNSTRSTHGSSVTSEQQTSPTGSRRDSSAGAVVLWEHHDSDHSGSSDLQEHDRSSLSEVQRCWTVSRNLPTAATEQAVDFNEDIRISVIPVPSRGAEPRLLQNSVLEPFSKEFRQTVAFHEDSNRFSADLEAVSTTTHHSQPEARAIRKPQPQPSGSSLPQPELSTTHSEMIFDASKQENVKTLTSTRLEQHQKNFRELDPDARRSSHQFSVITPIPMMKMLPDSR